MKIKVYTRDNCVQCKATKRFLDRYKVGYEEVDVDESLEYLKNKGFSTLPVIEVVNGNDEVISWYGFRPDKLKGLAG